MPGRERDQVREPFERHAIALMHHPGNRVAQLEKFRHREPPAGGGLQPEEADGVLLQDQRPHLLANRDLLEDPPAIDPA